jgi:hypothetical protein
MRLRFGRLAFIVVYAAIASSKAEASAILFTDRAAFDLAAEPNLGPLRTTDVTYIAAGQLLYTYGGILPVFMDIGIGCCFSMIGDVGSIPQGGEPLGNGYVGVGQFSTPITAVGYDVWGEFMLNGIAVNATSPIFFGFLFDQPTTHLPLPEIALFPRPVGPPRQGLSITTNIAVRTVPEPSTMFSFLLGTAAVLLAATNAQGIRRRSRRSRGPITS